MAGKVKMNKEVEESVSQIYLPCISRELKMVFWDLKL